ncbi:hypothetical protein GCM10010191_85650 [Actinomadura vinacea]|uniref:DUF1440 domain-containing protein n=1 Tax=Actinomadura vinacea TaxID=115336 RepID=A0ABN3KAG1_9ACTN
MGSLTNSGNTRAVVRAGARGLLAAMAMTGIRNVAAAIGPHEKTPPQALMDEHAPPSVHRLPERHRQAITELAHWGYGAVGGVVYGMLPREVRTHPATGPAYGLAAWLAFEALFAPALRLRHVHEHGFLWRAVGALDHTLYGIVVAGRLAPEPVQGDRRRSQRRRLIPRARFNRLLRA